MNGRGARLSGVAILLVALAVAAEAIDFRVNFPTDPLGPGAFPLLASGLLALGGLALLMQSGWGSGGDASHPPEDDDEPPKGRRMLAAAGILVGYALVLEPAGFLLATTVTFGALARLFGGRFRTGLASGLAFSAALLALFVWGLGLALPVFPGGWGG